MHAWYCRWHRNLLISERTANLGLRCIQGLSKTTHQSIKLRKDLTFDIRELPQEEILCVNHGVEDLDGGLAELIMA